MNTNAKLIISFLSGAAIGSLVTFFSVKKIFELKADLEIEEVRKVYEDKVNEEAEHKNSLDGELEGPEVIDVKKKVNELNNKPSITDLTDYTKYFKSKGERIEGVNETLRDAKEAADNEGLSEEELAEMEGPEDDEPYTDEEDLEQQLEYEDHKLNGAMKEAIAENKPPVEIEPSDYELTCANYEKTSLIWYHFDRLLANEEGELVDEELLVGDVISESGFDDNDNDVLYVRNDKIQADYEITKVYEAYGNT